MKIKKISKVWYIVIVLVVLAIVGWLFSRCSGKKEEVSFSFEKVGPATIQNSITATGTVEPVVCDTVGTQVSGIVSKIYVDYNSYVKKGQLLAELDKSTLNATLKSAQADLASAKANLQSYEANLRYQTANYKRYQTLYKKGLVSADDYENAYLTYKQAIDQVATGKQAIISAQQQVSTAQTNIGYATITSPIDGIVLLKGVSEGQTVAASFNTPQLFIIAQDLKDMEVVADVDEADISGVKEGEHVTFTVDAYPDDVFEGTVRQVRLKSTTSNNVVTYKVVISAPNDDLKLKPGLTASVTIYTAEKDGVLSVTNKALRFTPTKETVGSKKIVDCNGKNKVWVVDGNQVKAIPVSIGMTDGTHTQILSGLKSGQEIITELQVKTDEEETDESSEGEASPFAPGPHKNDKNKK